MNERVHVEHGGLSSFAEPLQISFSFSCHQRDQHETTTDHVKTCSMAIIMAGMQVRILGAMSTERFVPAACQRAVLARRDSIKATWYSSSTTPTDSGVDSRLVCLHSCRVHRMETIRPTFTPLPFHEPFFQDSRDRDCQRLPPSPLPLRSCDVTYLARFRYTYSRATVVMLQGPTVHGPTPIERKMKKKKKKKMSVDSVVSDDVRYIFNFRCRFSVPATTPD
jgi:hypothetical protein